MDAFLWSIAGALLMFIVSTFVERSNKHEDDIITELKLDLKEYSLELKALNKELTKFGALVERLDEKTAILPKLRDDVNLLWAKIKSGS